MCYLSVVRRPSRLIRTVLFSIAVVALLIGILLPLYYIFLTAFSPRGMLFTKPLTYLPATLTLERFRLIFSALPLARYLANTFFLSTVSTLIALLISFLGAYAIARLRFPGANVVLVGLLASGMLPGVTTVIPLFQMFRAVGLLNTLAGLLILYTSVLLPFTTWILASFIRQMPAEVEEAAEVDGANIWQRLWEIVLPIIRPGIATMFILDFIDRWNDFFTPLIFAQGSQARVITLALFEAQTIQSSSQYYTSWGNMAAVALIIIIPLFLITLVFQRQVVGGITAGVFK